MSLPALPFVRLPIALLVGASILAGCSGSGDSAAPSGTGTTGPDRLDVAAGNVEAGGDDLTADADEMPDGAASDDVGSAGRDPVAQDTLRVDFEITVPAYMSDALQVRLAWDGSDVAATWVGDEYWTADGVLPMNAATDLTVTFFDGNGDLVLGTAQTSFRTGAEPAQPIRITAEQFDTARWDDDGDGASNLDESVAGTDPRAAETQDLEIRETFSPFNAFARPRAVEGLERASAFFESSLPETLPWSEDIEDDVEETYGFDTPGYTSRRIIDLDASGNGSYFVYSQQVGPSDNAIGTSDADRTVDDGVVTWTGTYRRSDYSAAVSEDFTFTTASSIVDATTRRQDGTIDYVHQGFDSGQPTRVGISYSLTGTPVAGTPDCEPVAGRIRFDDLRFVDPDVIEVVTTLTKAADDEYWLVSSVTSDGELMERYLLRSIGTDFHCDIDVR